MPEFGFDRRNGELLVGAAAIELRQEEAGLDVLPLPDLLRSEPFPFEPGDFVRPHIIWDREKCLEAGRWTLTLLDRSESPQPVSLHKEHMRRLHVLGLGPGIKEVTVKNGFQNFTDYKQQVDAPMLDVRGIFEDWDIDQFVHFIDERWPNRKVTASDLDKLASEGEGPSRYIISKLGGLPSELNEIRGFYNIRSWDLDDFVEWGAKVIAANNHDTSLMTTTVVGILGDQGRGPSWRTIIKHFGKWSHFKQLAIQEHVALRDRESEAAQSLLRYWAGKAVLQDSVILDDPEKIVAFILKARPDIDRAMIETSAAGMHTADILWPHDNFRHYLRVSAQQLVAARKKAATVRQRYR